MNLTFQFLIPTFIFCYVSPIKYSVQVKRANFFFLIQKPRFSSFLAVRRMFFRAPDCLSVCSYPENVFFNRNLECPYTDEIGSYNFLHDWTKR